MPMYSYKCPVCKRTKTEVKPMAESDSDVFCLGCQVVCNRDFQTDLPHAAKDTYDRPIISDSMAVAVDQIPEHKKMFPDIRITPAGQPILENYSQHQAYLSKCGFVKQLGKQVNNSGKTVITMSDIRKKLTTV